MKTCTKCKKVKPLSDFNAKGNTCKLCHNGYVQDHYQNNKDYYLEKAKRAYRAKQAWYIQVKVDAGPCTDCQMQYPHYVMQWDHLRDKEFDISMMVHRYGKARLLAEIAKCEIVCANCHAIRTWLRRQEG